MLISRRQVLKQTGAAAILAGIPASTLAAPADPTASGHRPAPADRRFRSEAVEQFILDQLDRAGLGHNTFTQEALALIVRSGEGLLRRTRNLCLGSLLEAVRDQTRVVDLKHVNRVLIQPHWRKDYDNPPPATPLVA